MESKFKSQIREKDELIESQKLHLSRQTFTEKDPNSEKSSRRQPDEGVNAMREISDLKHEIARLTESLSGFASFTQSSQQQIHSQSRTSFAEVRALESKESTTDFEKLDLDDLYSVQEELKKKMQETNQMI